MAGIDIPTALTNFYSYLVNANVVKSHALNPKSEYINGIDLDVQLEPDFGIRDTSFSADDSDSNGGSRDGIYDDDGVGPDFMDYLSDGVAETAGLINLYRHSIVDINLLRMVLLESNKALSGSSNGAITFKSSPVANNYQLSMT
jgi:hypothetical protein